MLRDVKEGILTTDICGFHSWLKLQNVENKCRPTDENDTGISHSNCVWYRLQAELGVPSFCNSRCDMYNFVMTGIISGVFSIIGIVCNISSFVVFRYRVIKTPTTYQLQWLAVVDTIFLLLYFIYVPLFHIINHLHLGRDNFYVKVIDLYIQVYIWPVFTIALTSTNWLTLFVGVYLAICKPGSNSYQHVQRHRRQYVMIVLSMAALFNIPTFFARTLSQDDEINMNLTSFGKSDLFRMMYLNTMHPVFAVWLPFIILLIVTTKIMVVLSKKQVNMQNLDTLNLNINTVLKAILQTFIICQLPLLVDNILHFISGLSASTPPGCGSFHFYNTGFEYVCLVLNSAARPFIYVVLQNNFTWSLRHNLRNERTESVEMGSM